MAPRSIWSGSVSFGLVNVPVKLYPAVTPKGVKFNQLNSITGAKISQKRVDSVSGAEVPWDDIVKGFDMGDHYVTLSDDELNSLRPEGNKMIELEAFVKPEAISYMAHEKNYFLGAKDVAADKPYKLLVRAMREQGVVGIGRVVLRTKEYIAAIRPVADQDVLVLSTLVWADEINDMPEAPGKAEPSAQELKMAKTLIGALTADWDHADHIDTYRESVVALIEAKEAGATFVPTLAPEEKISAPDLMAALDASIAAVKKPAKATPKRKAKV